MQQQSVEKSMFKLLNLLRESDGIVHYIYIDSTHYTGTRSLSTLVFFFNSWPLFVHLTTHTLRQLLETQLLFEEI